jgi:predicted hydrocarbon binding protein
MAGGSASVKGIALRGLLRSVKDHGWSIPEVIAALPAAQKEAFAQPIISSGWYPYSAFVALIRAIEARHGSGGEFALSRRLGRESAGRDLGATFRIISAMASVEFLLRRGQVFWAQYCDRGRMILEAPSKLSFVARMEDFPQIDLAHCHLIEGWLEGLGDALGAVDMTCKHTLCATRGDSHCEYLGRWTAQRGLLR